MFIIYVISVSIQLSVEFLITVTPASSSLWQCLSCNVVIVLVIWQCCDDFLLRMLDLDQMTLTKYHHCRQPPSS